MCSYAQKAISDTGSPASVVPAAFDRFAYTGKGICKGLVYRPVFVKNKVPVVSSPAAKKSPRTPLLRVHGNILYDVTYRSSIDTPYAEQDIYQHTVQTYLDITVKDKYPTRLYLTNRFSNSSVFRNFSDLNYQFNPQQFNRQIKDQIRGQLLKRLAMLDTSGLRAKLLQAIADLDRLQRWLQDPSVMQRVIEAREWAQLQRQRKQDSIRNSGTTLAMPDVTNPLPDLDAISMSKFKGRKGTTASSRQDSIRSRVEGFEQEYAAKKKYSDSLKKELPLLEAQYQQYRQKASLDNKQSLTDFDQVKNLRQLKEKMQDYQLPDTMLPKGYKQLFAVRSASIGRSVLDYSELTASNISITGLQLEYNPSYYAAIATGYVDYRFRNYTVRNSGPRQYLTLLRLGHGMKEGNHLFLSYYLGSRQLYNAASGSGTNTPNYKLVGYSVEGRYYINPTTYVNGEFAKSSLPYYNRSAGKEPLLSEAVRYDERSNEAYVIQFNSYIPATFTKLAGSFKRTGSNFQSFSVFTSGSTQTNWMARIDQPFFKRRLNIMASLKTNEAVNPYIGNNFKSNTVFKSIQATLRMRKWPTVSVGYYPSSQLTRLSEDQYTEQLFYTFVSNLTHFYTWKKTTMSSTLSYSRFYNKPTDSGFIYFNTRNLLLGQHILWNRFALQVNLSVSANTDYTLYVADNSCQYQIKDWLSLGAGIKYNSQPVFDKVLMGYSSNVTLKLGMLGEVQLMMDKGFIPGSQQQLVPNNVGRASYFKTF